MEFFNFDKAYVDRLRDGDPSTEQHFVAYFEQLIRIKLRYRRILPDKVEDLMQETFIRVIANLRKTGGIREPERFGAFVNSICNNILQEYYRAFTKDAKNQSVEDAVIDIPDKIFDLDGMLVTKQAAQLVRQVLAEMPRRDRDLLCAIYFQELEKDEVCKQFGVNRTYLRVLHLRAKDKFKVLYKKGPGRDGGRANGSGKK